MPQPLPIRPAAAGDAAALAEIYNQGIADRVGTFRTWPSRPADFVGRLRGGVREPLLVAEVDARVVAWAGVIPYSDDSYYDLSLIHI